jgi:hypothetical protein
MDQTPAVHSSSSAVRQRCSPVVQAGPLLDGAWEEDPITLDAGAEADEDGTKDEPGSWLLDVMREELPSALLEGGALQAPGWLVTVPDVDAPAPEEDVVEVDGLELDRSSEDTPALDDVTAALELWLLAAEDGLGPLLGCALELAEEPDVVLLEVPEEKLLAVPDDDVVVPHSPITQTRPEAQSWLVPHVSRQVPPEHT